VQPFLPVVLTVSALALAPAAALAGNSETEPNDTKAQANVFVLPAVSTPAFITGNSTSAAGTGLDYYRLTSAAQGTAGFYRHRITIQSSTPGHTVTLRGLTQTNGVIDPLSDVEFQIGGAPPPFVQWYTSQASADIYVRITGTVGTPADYMLDYDVQLAPEIALGASLAGGSITVSTVGQTGEDTDLWVYDMNRAAIPDAGNDDEFNGATLQSTLTRTYPPTGATYYVGISTFNMGNNLPSPADDDYRNGNVLDFPGAIANNVAATNQDVDLLFTDSGGPHPVSATKVGAFDVVFVSFFVALPVELMDFQIE